MPNINLHYVDELISVRQAQHGGGRGAPPILYGQRVGASINRSCIVMLSALLQAYVEEVFKDAAQRRFPDLAADPAAFDRYWNQMKNWGNPNGGNIKVLFLKLGVPDVLTGLSWQRTTEAEIQSKLDKLNQIRNKIAHGAAHITVNNQPYSLSLAHVCAFRDFAHNFGQRFEHHVEGWIP